MVLFVYLSASLLSVVCNGCIVAKRHVLPENCLKQQIWLLLPLNQRNCFIAAVNL